jgi:hypothetical protein
MIRYFEVVIEHKNTCVILNGHLFRGHVMTYKILLALDKIILLNNNLK